MNERMMILNMLQEGKITAEEAARLLASVDEQAAPSAAPPPPPPSSQRRPDSDFGRPVRSSGIDFDELGRKFAAFAKDLEPKVQKAADIVAEKTVYYADKLSKSLESGLEGMDTPSAPRRPASASSPNEGTERHIELTVDEGYNELSLSGLNGIVQVKGYNGDKISARIRYKEKRRGATIDLMKLGNKYYLGYEEDDFQFVAIDAYVPSHKFKIISVNGLNSPMDISALDCDQLELSNTNGSTSLSELRAESIKSESGNGHLTVKNLAAKQAVLEHFNGAVEAVEIDAEKLSLTNFNGPIALSTSAFARYHEYLWNVETSNAKLTMNVPSLPDLGYHVRSHVTLGNIRIGLTGLEYIINDPGLVEAQSAGFNGRNKKVRLALETSNAALTVN